MKFKRIQTGKVYKYTTTDNLIHHVFVVSVGVERSAGYYDVIKYYVLNNPDRYLYIKDYLAEGIWREA